jgi:pimeloyl-ACP methyl ester carboxylesterase
MGTRGSIGGAWTEADTRFDGFRIHSLSSSGETGDGVPLVFVPGLAAPARSMVPTAALLVGDRRVHVLDLPEHAEKGHKDAPLDLSQFANLTARWAKAFGIERAVWIGHSFGSQLLEELALQEPGLLDRLVLVSPTVDPRARTVARQAARLGLDATREPWPLLRLLVRDYRRAGCRRLLQLGRVAVGDRVEDKLPRVRVPTLVVRGERDPLVPARWAEEIVSLLPDAQLTVIRRAPHAVQYTHPDVLAGAVRSFLVTRAGGG